MELDGRAEVLDEGVGQRFHPHLQAGPQLVHVLLVMVLEKVRHHHLPQRPGAAVRLAGQHAAQHRPRRHHVAKAQGGRQGLGKGADVQNVVAVVQAIDGRRPLTFPDQVGVALVLEDRHAVFAAEAQHLVTTFHAEHRAGGVLQGGDGVDELGSDAVAAKVGERSGQGVHAHAVFVQWNANHVHVQLAPPAHHALIREQLGDDSVAGFQQDLVDELDALVGARGDEDVFAGRPQAAIVGQFLDEEAAQPGVALWAAFHVVRRQVLAFLPQHAGGGLDEVFNGHRLGVVMTADEVVGRKSTPGR